MPTNTYKTLAQGQVAAATAAIYTVAAATSSIIKEIIIINTDTVNHTLDVFQNGSAATNRIFGTGTLGPGESAVFKGTITLAAAGTIQAKADVGSVLTYTLNGVEIT